MTIHCIVSQDIASPYLVELSIQFERKYSFHIYHETPLELEKHIIDKAEVLITKTPPPNEYYSSAFNLKFIQLGKAGYEDFDIASIVSNNIVVSSNGGANARSVAEHIIMCMLVLARQLLQQELSVTRKVWNNLKSTNTELAGKTLGIIGYGHVGSTVADLASRLGMSVLYNDIKIGEVKENYPRASLIDVITLSDYLSLHTPLTKETTNLITKKTLSVMKSTAFLINTSRGRVVNECDLVWALKENIIAGAALDVFSEEPLPEDSPLFDCPNIVLTPHCGPSLEAGQKLFNVIADNLTRYLNRETLLHQATIYE